MEIRAVHYESQNPETDDRETFGSLGPMKRTMERMTPSETLCGFEVVFAVCGASGSDQGASLNMRVVGGQ